MTNVPTARIASSHPRPLPARGRGEEGCNRAFNDEASSVIARDSESAQSQLAPFGVYVHWPFCAQKCPYCDFNSHVRFGGWDESRARTLLDLTKTLFKARDLKALAEFRQ